MDEEESAHCRRGPDKGEEEEEEEKKRNCNNNKEAAETIENDGSSSSSSCNAREESRRGKTVPVDNNKNGDLNLTAVSEVHSSQQQKYPRRKSWPAAPAVQKQQQHPGRNAPNVHQYDISRVANLHRSPPSPPPAPPIAPSLRSTALSRREIALLANVKCQLEREAAARNRDSGRRRRVSDSPRYFYFDEVCEENNSSSSLDPNHLGLPEEDEEESSSALDSGLNEDNSFCGCEDLIPAADPDSAGGGRGVLLDGVFSGGNSSNGGSGMGSGDGTAGAAAGTCQARMC